MNTNGDEAKLSQQRCGNVIFSTKMKETSYIIISCTIAEKHIFTLLEL